MENRVFEFIKLADRRDDPLDGNAVKSAALMIAKELDTTEFNLMDSYKNSKSVIGVNGEPNFSTIETQNLVLIRDCSTIELKNNQKQIILTQNLL